MSRTLAIGDIHGCSTALRTLLENVKAGPDDHVIFLGDYVDRGPDSKDVIDQILALKEHTKITCLRGNHEVVMNAARKSMADECRWLTPTYGGASTLASYGTTQLSEIPAEHKLFLDRLLPFHETATHIFVHANLHPRRSLQDQTDDFLYWEHLSRPVAHQSGKVMVCGHTAQADGQILDLQHTVCIDTGACNGGWLTCLEVDSGSFDQANEQGETRSGQLAR